MKNITKILSAAVVLLSFAACQEKAEFVTYPYARLEEESYSVAENGGSIDIPVYVYAQGESVNTTVSFEVTSGTAKEGTDFTVTPSNGVLTVSGSNKGYIKINVVNHEGVFTGDTYFTVKLVGVTNDYTLGAYREATITIKDLDDPRSAFLGSWTVDAEGYFGGEYTIAPTIIADPDDNTYTRVIICNLDPYFAGYGYTYANGVNYMYGTMNDERTAIVAENAQAMGYSSCLFMSFNDPSADNATDYADFTFNLNSDGTLTLPNAWGVYLPGGGWYSLYNGPFNFAKK